jgi:CBS domain containing-hemolysin-like protein
MIDRGGAADLLVRDVMDPAPKTTSASTTVGELRSWFEADAHVRTALLSDGATFLGAVALADLPPDAPVDQLALEFSRRPAHVIGPERRAAEALAQLDAGDACRAVVLDRDDETLLGLVCMNAARTHFCVPK